MTVTLTLQTRLRRVKHETTKTIAGAFDACHLRCQKGYSYMGFWQARLVL
jgi:hypothetical protein